MFKWIKNKINKRKHREHYNAIGQCGNFLTYAMSFTENSKLEKYSSLYPLLSIKNKILDKISRKFKKELLNTTDANDLMGLNKDCRILYDKHFNWMGKSFDEEYTPAILRIKGDIDLDYSYKKTKPELVQPIILEVGPRISGGVVVAVAKTADGGAASVTWDTENKSWVFAEGFGVGTVFAADPAPASILMAKGIPNQTKD